MHHYSNPPNKTAGSYNSASMERPSLGESGTRGLEPSNHVCTKLFVTSFGIVSNINQLQSPERDSAHGLDVTPSRSCLDTMEQLSQSSRLPNSNLGGRNRSWVYNPIIDSASNNDADAPSTSNAPDSHKTTSGQNLDVKPQRDFEKLSATKQKRLPNDDISNVLYSRRYSTATRVWDFRDGSGSESNSGNKKGENELVSDSGCTRERLSPGELFREFRVGSVSGLCWGGAGELLDARPNSGGGMLLPHLRGSEIQPPGFEHHRPNAKELTNICEYNELVLNFSLWDATDFKHSNPSFWFAHPLEVEYISEVCPYLTGRTLFPIKTPNCLKPYFVFSFVDKEEMVFLLYDPDGSRIYRIPSLKILQLGDEMENRLLLKSMVRVDEVTGMCVNPETTFWDDRSPGIIISYNGFTRDQGPPHCIDMATKAIK